MAKSVWRPIDRHTPKRSAILVRPIARKDQMTICTWTAGPTLSDLSNSGWVDRDGWMVCDSKGRNGAHEYEYIEVPK